MFDVFADKDPQRFYKKVESRGIPLLKDKEIPSKAFLEWLKNNRLVLCVEEFDVVFDNEVYRPLYDDMLKLADLGNLSLVLVTHQPLSILVNYGYENFVPLEVKPLTQEAALSLLMSRGLTREEAEWVISNVSDYGNPGHLQVLGANLQFEKQYYPLEKAKEEALNIEPSINATISGIFFQENLIERANTFDYQIFGLNKCKNRYPK